MSLNNGMLLNQTELMPSIILHRCALPAMALIYHLVYLCKVC
jgi:hypothetical protein